VSEKEKKNDFYFILIFWFFVPLKSFFHSWFTVVSEEQQGVDGADLFGRAFEPRGDGAVWVLENGQARKVFGEFYFIFIFY